MKSLYKYFAISFTFIFVCLFQNNLKAEEISVQRYEGDRELSSRTLSVGNLSNKFAKNAKSQSTNFVLWDSLFNLYTYFNVSVNNSLVYEPETKSLMFLKRGFFNRALHPTYTGSALSDNLVLRTSSDWGKNWTNDQVIYNVSEAGQTRSARYPSVAGVKYEGELTAVYNTPIVQQGEWVGHNTGIWNSSFGSVGNFLTANQQFDQMAHTASTQSKVLAKISKSGQLIHFVAMPLTPSITNETNRNSIGYYKFTDGGAQQNIVPPQWNSSKFQPVTTEGSRFNELVNLRMNSAGNLYCGVYGSFADIATPHNRPAFSFSTDDGDTWSEFNIIPIEVKQQFTISQGANQDSSSFDWASKDFVVFDNGDVSYALNISISDAASGVNKRMLVEAYHSNGQWGIRKIADWNGYTILYSDIRQADPPGSQDSISVNPADKELQLAITEDGNGILAKWVETEVAIDEVSGQASVVTTDIFIAGRNRSSNTWGTKRNITESDEIDRASIIPNIIPNNFSQVPIFKSYAFFASEDQERSQQFRAGDLQRVYIGFIDYVASVEDEKAISDILDFQSIFPNPANNQTTLNFEMEKETIVSVELYDIMGIKLQTIANNYLDKGYHSLLINTEMLNAGNYFVKITSEGKNLTKKITVIR